MADDVRVTVDEAAIKELMESPEVVEYFGREASERRGRAGSIPPHLTLITRSGVGPHGTFSQIILRGPGAAAWEFGTRTHAPHGTVRRTIGG